MQQWLLIEQVEDLLWPLKRNTIRIYAARGRIVARRQAPRLQLYLRSSVEEYRERHLGRKGWSARRRAAVELNAATTDDSREGMDTCMPTTI